MTFDDAGRNASGPFPPRSGPPVQPVQPPLPPTGDTLFDGGFLASPGAVAIARRAAVAAVSVRGGDAGSSDELALVVSELATNAGAP
ncbi:hypothetical protein GCM10022221_08870 [Actinocorallia aurea]